MSALDATSVVRAAPNVYARSFGDEIVLLEFGKGDYFGLDEVGAEVWRGIEHGSPLGVIAEKITKQFAVSIEQALSDVVDLVKELREHNLVRT